jgi:hypothetical protein
VGRAVGRWLEGQRDHPVAIGPGVGRSPSGPGRIAQPGQPIGFKAASPEQDRHEVHTALGGDPLVGHAIGRVEDDPGPLREPLLGRSGPHQAVEGGSFGWAHSQRKRGRMSHVMDRSCDPHNGLVTSALVH